ncbi:hypothetical protein [Paenibacillus psychroresistens]|nr:hypothetical protein [Paenibacillus psychroresistens]
MEKESIKRYAPAAILASFLMAVYNVIAFNQKHWIIKVVIIPWLKPLFVSGVFGMFIIATLWIFHLTFGKFWVYLVTNIVMDFMFAVFPFHYLLQEKLGVYQLIHITPWERWFIFVAFALILYGYQIWQAEIFKTKEQVWSRSKEKVR